MLIVLLIFGEPLGTNFMSLDNEPCMGRPTINDLNHIELQYYPFMISLNKCSGSCNAANNFSPKICVPSKTKDVNVKVLNMITYKNEAKTMVKHISCVCKCKFNSTTYNSNEKWNNDKCQCECKSYHKCKKDYSWNPSTCIFENSKHLKHYVNDRRIVCDEVIHVIDIVSTNVTSTISINSEDKKVRYKMDCYILHTVLLVIILLFMISIICYHYAKHRSKLKKHIAVLKM